MRNASFGTRAQAVFASWEETKLFIEHSMGVSTESLHIFGGVLILLVAAAVLRKPVSSWWPLLVVLAFAILNEVSDLTFRRWPHPGAQFGEGAKDIFVTMLVPAALMFTARKTPGLFRPDDQTSSPSEDASATDIADPV